MKILAPFLLTALINFHSYAETISIKGDYWCPFNCGPKDSKKGYMIEIIKTIFEKKGHNIDYQLDTWTNSILSVRDGKTTALIAANVFDAPDFIYPKSSLGVSKDCFFVRQNDKWEYHQEENLKSRKIGIVESYAYSRTVNDFIKSNPSQVIRSKGIEAITGLDELIKKNEIDTIVENPIVFNYYVEHNLKNSHYEEAGCGESSDLYLAFSPKNPKSKEFADLLSNGIEELRKNGTLDRILAKYSIKEWR